MEVKPPRFADFLARVDGNEEVDFNSFCASHPEERPELELLHRDWVQLRHVLSRLGFSGSLSERIRERYGDEIDPEAVLLDGAGPRPEARDADPSTRRYLVQGHLGRGGQGEVLHVWDQNLKRSLAMKVALPRPDGEFDSRALARLLEEAQVTGQLDHPGIVPIHELGLDTRGRIYFTMKLVKGRSLNEIFELVQRGEQGWTPPRAVGVVLRACEAMTYAHSKGVVHRDLKPDNIMVGEFGEVYVMDWGLARVLGADGSESEKTFGELQSARNKLDPESPFVTQDGDVLGTPAYMPPEQARGDRDAIGPTTDVYALGAILYHALAKYPPYSAEAKRGVALDPRAVLTRVLAGPPESLAVHAPDAPLPLIAICEKAMARNSGDRYSTTEALEQDLRAFLENRVVGAFQTGALAEARTWVRRNGALAASLGAALVLGVLGLVIALAAQTQASLAAERRLSLEFLKNYADNLNQVNRGEIETRRAHRLLDDCTEEYRGWEWDHFWLRHDQSRLVLRGHTDSVLDVALAPKLTRGASASADGTVRIWDLSTGDSRALEITPERDPVSALDFSSDGGHLVVGSSDGIVRVFETESFALVARLEGMSDEVEVVAFGPDERIAAASRVGEIRIWERPWSQESLTRLCRPLTWYERIHTLEFLDAPDPRLMSVSRSEAKLWNLRTGVGRVEMTSTAIVASTPAGIVVWGGRAGADLAVRDLTSHEDQKIALGLGFANALSLSSGGDLLAAGFRTGEIQIASLAERASLQTLRGHESRITSLDFAQDGSFLLSGSEDSTVRLWERGVNHSLMVHLGDWPIVRTQFLDGDQIAILMADGRLVKLDARTGRVLFDRIESNFVPPFDLIGRFDREPEVRDSPPAIFTHDGSTLVRGELSGAVIAFEVATGEPSGFSVDAGAIGGLALDSAERLLATGSEKGEIELWSWPDGGHRDTIRASGTAISALTFTPSGDRLIWGTESGWIHVHDLRTGEDVASWEAFAGESIRALHVEAGGRLLVGTDSAGPSLWSLEQLWRVEAPAMDGVPEEALLTSIASSREGGRIVVAFDAGSVLIWETDARTAARWKAEWGSYPVDLAPDGPAESAVESVRGRSVRRRVDDLFETHLFPDEVAAALEASTLEASLLSLALEYASMTALSPAELVAAAWGICQEDERSPRFRQRAKRAAREACDQEPDETWFRAVLGAAHYRLGEHQAAERELQRALEPSWSDGKSEEAFARAIRSLVLDAIGRPEEAREELERAFEAARLSGSEETIDTVGELTVSLR